MLIHSTFVCLYASLCVCFAVSAPSFRVPPPSSYAPLPDAVTSFGAAAQNGWLYVYGGHRGERHEYSSNDVSAVCRRLSLTDGFTWESLPADAPAQSPGLVIHRGALYRVGGMAARNPKGAKHDLHSHASVARLKVASRRWEPLPSLPDARSSHDAVIVADRLYVAGGWYLAGGGVKPVWHDTALVLALSRNDAGWESFPQPFKRRGLALAALGEKLYCLGGMSEGDAPSLEVDVLNTSTGLWTKGPDLPPGRMKGFGASACVAEGRLYVSGMSGVVWRLSEDGGRWEEFARLRTPRFFHRLVPGGDGQLLAVGGEGADGKLRDIEIVQLRPLAAGAWPGFRGPNRDGITSESLVTTNWPKEGPPVLWRAELGKGLSSFSVSDGRVFTLGNANNVDTLWCLNTVNGQVVWRFDYPCASTNHPMPVVPYGPAATPTVFANKVYSLSREGDFLCVDAASGKLVWRKHLVADLGGKRPVYGYANSPLLTDGVAILDVGGMNGSTVALDANTGATRWRSGRGEAGYSSPRLTMLDGQPALALFKGEAFTLLDPHVGAPIAEHPITTRDFCNTITPVVTGSSAFISNTGKDGTLRLDFTGADRRVVWQKTDFGLLFNSPALWKGRLYGFNDAKRNANELMCVDAATGETCWTFGDVEKGVFTIADGRMILLTRLSELVILALDGSEPKIVVRAQLIGGKSWAEPVFADGRIYLRNNDGNCVCIDSSVSKSMASLRKPTTVDMAK
jgi:outer membrane protein assembly factor BamB